MSAAEFRLRLAALRERVDRREHRPVGLPMLPKHWQEEAEDRQDDDQGEGPGAPARDRSELPPAGQSEEPR